jgi:endonuclease/exonuclease/phosphatase family metal-dependent hydrolase
LIRIDIIIMRVYSWNCHLTIKTEQDLKQFLEEFKPVLSSKCNQPFAIFIQEVSTYLKNDMNLREDKFIYFQGMYITFHRMWAYSKIKKEDCVGGLLSIISGVDELKIQSFDKYYLNDELKSKRFSDLFYIRAGKKKYAMMNVHFQVPGNSHDGLHPKTKLIIEKVRNMVDDCDLVLAGDFNLKPSEMHKMRLLDSVMDTEMPTNFPEDKSKNPMRLDYVCHIGHDLNLEMFMKVKGKKFKSDHRMVIAEFT